jgi:hypothetical protein
MITLPIAADIVKYILSDYLLKSSADDFNKYLFIKHVVFNKYRIKTTKYKKRKKSYK